MPGRTSGRATTPSSQQRDFDEDQCRALTDASTLMILHDNDSEEIADATRALFKRHEVKTGAVGPNNGCTQLASGAWEGPLAAAAGTRAAAPDTLPRGSGDGGDGCSSCGSSGCSSSSRADGDSSRSSSALGEACTGGEAQAAAVACGPVLRKAVPPEVAEERRNREAKRLASALHGQWQAAGDDGTEPEERKEAEVEAEEPAAKRRRAAAAARGASARRGNWVESPGAARGGGGGGVGGGVGRRGWGPGPPVGAAEAPRRVEDAVRPA